MRMHRRKEYIVRKIMLITSIATLFIVVLTSCSMDPTSIATETIESESANSNTGSFTLSSPDVVEGGTRPVAYTCDGDSATLPLTWSGAPTNTESFAVVMHHIPGSGDTHWYWVLYDIPADVTSLAQNSSGVGTLGNNSVNGER